MDWLQAAIDVVSVLLTLPAMKGALVGTGTAALVDYGAFRKWQKWSDLYQYDWRVASFRWAQGAVVGALAGYGLGVVS